MPHEAAEASFKVVYVMGFGRSGSTLLDILLDNHPDIRGVGELQNVPKVAWSGEAVCSCGTRARDCEYWGAVREGFEREAGPEAVQELIALDDRYCRTRVLARLVLDWTRRAPRLMRYMELRASLYRSLAEVSGARVIVDSSKHPTLAYILMRTRGLDARVIHLVRDGRAVMWSTLRKQNLGFDERGLTTARESGFVDPTRFWLGVNLISSFVARGARGRAARVTHEDLVTRPADVLRELGELLQLDMTPLTREVEQDGPLRIRHLAAGNRIRVEDEIRIRSDIDWPDELPSVFRERFWRRAGWLARRYGYRREGPPPDGDPAGS